MSNRFTNHVVLVAGGTGALGRAVTAAFLAEGAFVAVTYQKADEFAQLRDEAGNNAERLTGYPVDVTDESAVRRVVAGIAERLQRLEVLVNAVGGYSAGPKLWEGDGQVLGRMLGLNVVPGYVLARAVLPVMLQQGYGAIVNVAAQAAFDPPAGGAAYAASKAATVAMMRSLAAEVAGKGIRVNSIAPVIMDTPANRAAMPNANHERWSKVADVASVVLFLASPQAKVVHGVTLTV